MKSASSKRGPARAKPAPAAKAPATRKPSAGDLAASARAAKAVAVKTGKTSPRTRPPSPEAATPRASDGASAAIAALKRRLETCLDDAKAENVVSIDLHGRSSIADYMVVATGRSTTHVAAIADRLIKSCKEAGMAAPRVEGLPNCDWVLVDAGDIVVHVFRPDVRDFYKLEKMWGGDRPADTSVAQAARA